MKKIVMILTSLILIISCSSTTGEHMKYKMKKASPASINCINNGGKLITLEEYSETAKKHCKLKDGQIIEEWDYYKQLYGGYQY